MVLAVFLNLNSCISYNTTASYLDTCLTEIPTYVYQKIGTESLVGTIRTSPNLQTIKGFSIVE